MTDDPAATSREAPKLTIHTGLVAEWLLHPHTGEPLLRIGPDGHEQGYRLSAEEARKLADWILGLSDS